eukprot:scaffold144964_cov18-Prasinocladus_malaysianus.AAC.1
MSQFEVNAADLQQTDDLKHSGSTSTCTRNDVVIMLNGYEHPYDGVQTARGRQSAWPERGSKTSQRREERAPRALGLARSCSLSRFLTSFDKIIVLKIAGCIGCIRTSRRPQTLRAGLAK